MSSHPTYCGVDFAKEKFDYHTAELRGSLPNTPAGHRRFLAMLPTGVHLVGESTGHYHRALVAAAHAEGVAVTVANPRQVRDLAKGLGRRAKTDPIDAQTLYDFGRAAAPEAAVAPRVAQTALQELVVARQQAVLERSTVMLQAAGHQLALVRKLTKARLKLLSAQIAQLDVAMAKTVAAEKTLAAQSARLVEVRGVGALTAATVLALCPELGTLSRNEAAALLGVAPFDHDSGQCKGQRHIAGGRFRLRCALSMAALSAARSNAILRAFYLRLRAAGKPAKLALTAVMRKLFILLNHLLKKPTFQLAS